MVAFDSGLGLSGVWLKDIKPGAPSPIERMRMAREQQKRNRQRIMKKFNTVEEAVEANANNEVFKKSTITARNIVMRHIRPHPSGGFTFTHDMRTYGQVQYVCLTEEQTRAFLRGIECQVLKIEAKTEEARYPQEYRQYFADRLKCVKHLKQVLVLGGHHIHSDNAEETAEAVIAWFNKNDFFSKHNIQSRL
jgi:hypothetical protein